MTLATQVRRYARELAAAIALILIAAGVAGYVLSQQRVRFPWEDVYRLSAQFSSAQAVTPGQGQNVTVAGVTVGEIVAVRLHGGRALVEMEIDRSDLPEVYRDARLLLRPKTGLNDMSIQMDPGTRRAGALDEGAVIPLARTLPHVNPDEVLAALDADTRAYLAVVVNAAGDGVRGRSADLRAVLHASQPTVARLHRITAAVADRRAKLRRLVHDLRLLSGTAATRDAQLGQLVDAGNATLGALASQEDALREGLERLPGTLEAAREALVAVEPFARRLGPASQALRPAARRIRPTVRALEPLARQGTPILRRQLRPLVREARPLVSDLTPAVADLRAVTPSLTRAFVVLNRVVNELGHNPEGPEEGYLYWLAWFAHNANSVLGIEDAHGVSWRGQLIGSCSSYAVLEQTSPLLQLLFAFPHCPKDASR